MGLKAEGEMTNPSEESLLVIAAEIERQFLAFVEAHSLQLLRYALVVVFIWFGLLTATGVSETAGLVADIFWFVPRETVLILLGGWEIAVGMALLFRRTLRLAGVLLAAHATVVMLPLVLYPSETFSYFPYGPSFEGVYIIKDVVLLAGTMTVGGLFNDTSDRSD